MAVAAGAVHSAPWSGPAGAALRAQARDALAAGGLQVDEARAQEYLRASFAAAASDARDLARRLRRLGGGGDVFRSFVDAVPTMTAFASSVTDAAYELTGASRETQPDARRALALYVLASAIFDRACDEDANLMRELGDGLSDASLQAALERGTMLARERARLPLVRSFWVLVDDFVQIVDSMASRAHQGAHGSRAQLVRTILDAYRAAMGASHLSAADVWASPLYVAYLLTAVGSGSVSAPEPELEDLVRSTGELFMLVDDVADISEDWTNEARNSLLDLIRRSVGHRHPSPADLTEPVTSAHMDRIRELARAIATAPCASGVSAWLHYWLCS